MRVVSHPEAEQELAEAVLWYEERQAGLGDDFLDEFEAALTRILANPQAGREIFQGNHKHNFHRFPFAIIHAVQGQELLIKAVMHLHRCPFYWKNRE
jgi:hypothetical protein